MICFKRLRPGFGSCDARTECNVRTYVSMRMPFGNLPLKRRSCGKVCFQLRAELVEAICVALLGSTELGFISDMEACVCDQKKDRIVQALRHVHNLRPA